MQLTPRQAQILRTVVQEYVDSGHPVGSKALAESPDLPWGSSTIRAELAQLEELGLLGHPHTSAGRMPTDAGYRHYADALLAADKLPVRAKRFELELTRAEVDQAMRTTTAQLSQITNLLAIVSAPPIASTTIRRVEVLLLQPQLAMVVVITSTGGVTKRMVSYGEPVDRGLVDWAASYLNETLGGMAVGARMLASKLADPTLGSAERSFLDTLAPAFAELEDTAEDTLYVDGAARLMSEDRFQELSQLGDLMAMLERRVSFLSLLRGSLAGSSVSLRIGAENEAPELRALSVVAAGYGTAARTLGAVSVVGPVRMDYANAIGTVREAAAELSRFVEKVWEQ